MQYDTAHALARQIRESEEYLTCHQLKEQVMADETTAALIREYKKLQLAIQMSLVSGHEASETDRQRFSGITSLLLSRQDVSDYLLSEMRLQQTMADIFHILTEAADLDMPMPSLD